MEKVRFTVLHPAGTNVDITKDEGQIPYTLAKLENIDAKMVSCHIDYDCCNIENVPGLSIKHIPLIINNTITGLLYLLKNSRQIDWLNIYFAGRQAYIWMRLYKFLNKKGCTYLKLDMDYRSCDLYDSNPKERRIFTRNTLIADIVSVESVAVKKRISRYSKKEIFLVEDGISKLKFCPNTNTKRENLFLTVGRLGTCQKATDVLLEAFANSALNHNWKLKLVGNIEKEFNKKIEDFYEKYPHLRQRVIFTGPINDRETLYSEYCSAKVFVLPSRWESYGISAAEALSCGCHLILSDSIPPANEMTNFEKYGEIVKVDNVEQLSKAMTNATLKKYEQATIDEIVKYANMQFSWERICKKLLKEMNRINKENPFNKK